MLADLLLKTKKKIQKCNETRDSRYIYQNELDNVCFQYDMTYGDFKNCLKEQPLIKNYVIKHLILLKILSMMDIKRSCINGLQIF